MDSQVSHNLVSSHFGIKRRKLFFNSPQHYMNQLLKLFRKRREKKKKEKEIYLIQISFLRWTWTWKNYVMEIFVLKTAMKTAVKTFTSVWIISLLFMRINAIRFLQSKGTINIQILNIRSFFFLFSYHDCLIHLSRSLYCINVRFESSKHFFYGYKISFLDVNRWRSFRWNYFTTIFILNYCSSQTYNSVTRSFQFLSLFPPKL